MSTENQPITVLSVYTTFAWVQPVGSSSGITLPIADGRYLKKLTPDTATAIETFSGGINTSFIDPLNLSVLDIANTTYSLFGGVTVNIGKNMTVGKVNALGTGTATFDVNGAGIQTNNLNSLGSLIDLNIGNNLVNFGDNLYFASNKVGGSVDMFISAGGSATFDVYGAGIRCSKLNPRSTVSNFLIGNDFTNDATNIQIAPNKTIGNVNVFESAVSTATFQVNGSGIQSAKINPKSTATNMLIGNDYTNQAGNIDIGINKTLGTVNVLAAGTATLQVNGAGIQSDKMNSISTATNLSIGNDYTNQAGNIDIGTNKTLGTVNVLAAGTGTMNVNGAGIKTNAISQILTTDTFTIGNGGPLTINAKNTTSGICPVVGNQLLFTHTVTIRTVPTFTAYCPTTKLEVGGIYGLRLRMFTTKLEASSYAVSLTSRGTPIPNATTGLTAKYDGALGIENETPITTQRWGINVFNIIKVESNEEYLAINTSISSAGGGLMNYELQVTRLA